MRGKSQKRGTDGLERKLNNEEGLTCLGVRSVIAVSTSHLYSNFYVDDGRTE